jgi:sporulation integral membrane protein YlbJ
MRSNPGRITLAVLTVTLIAAIAARPRTAFEGALAGMDTWWNIVFPALLPFFIVSELVLGLGLASIAGALLEPVMRPLFRLPGSASFAVAVGYSSGYPVGANFTARLRTERMCTRAEAEHLLTFVNNASPLFILVAISVGMFNNPALGPFILAVHYLSNLTLGLLFRGYRRRERGPAVNTANLWKRAFHQFLATDNRHPGQILGDAVKSAVNKLLVIGGFIILFAVIVNLLSCFGLLPAFAGLLGFFLQPLGLAPELYLPLATGVFEMTLGTRLVSETAAPLLQQLIAVQLILAWSGLSIQAQVAAFVTGTDIRLGLYFLGRLAHAALAVALTLLLFPAFENLLVAAAVQAPAAAALSWTAVLQTATLLALTLPLGLLSFAMLLHTIRRLFRLFHVF